LARQVVMELFTAYRGAPHEMTTSAPTTSSLNRAIADYIAGMTDRFAIKEHARLTGMRLFATDDL